MCYTLIKVGASGALAGWICPINGTGFYSPYVEFDGSAYVDTGIMGAGVYDFEIGFRGDFGI